MKNYIQLQDRVREAFEEERPVVALESTLFAHGLPYPENLDLYLELEAMALDEGVVPAVVAIMDRKIIIGLDHQVMRDLSSREEFHKASLVDVPILLSKGLPGATTVATTMQIADLVGIKTFVTGGLGGVHRGGEETFDISADLMALSKFHVLVISSGVKSILDLQKTRELLETLGIPTLGYESSHFPAFYLRESGFRVDHKVDSLEEVVEIFKLRGELGLRGGLLLTNPIPEEYEQDPISYHRLLNSLLTELELEELRGKEITPYLLRRLKEETGGATLEANLALVKNNMELGCKMAHLLKDERL